MKLKCNFLLIACVITILNIIANYILFNSLLCKSTLEKENNKIELYLDTNSSITNLSAQTSHLGLLPKTYLPQAEKSVKTSLTFLFYIIVINLISFLALNLSFAKILFDPLSTLAKLVKSFAVRAKLNEKDKVFEKLRSMNPNNEIGILANDFATSLEIMWNKDSQIQQTSGALEEKVRVRTIELVTLNEKLQQEIGERYKAEAALEYEKRNLALILDSNPIPTFVIDINHNVIIWNRACEELTAVLKAVVINKPLNPKIFYQRGELPVLADLVLDMDEDTLVHYYGNKNLYKNSTIGESFEASDRLSFLGKKPAHIYFMAALLRNDKGGVIGAIETMQDITEKELLQIQLQHSQKMEAVGTLTAGMAHEFNNILAGIQGYVQLMKAKGKDYNNFDRYIDEIDTNCHRASGLTRKMLTFTRKNVDEKQPVKVNQLIDGMHSLIRQTITPEIELEVDLQQHLPFTMAETTQIEQVLLNLVVNARDAMPGVGKIIIRTRLAELNESSSNIYSLANAGNYILIEVEDTGNGMSQDIIEHIFEPFFTTKDPGKGTGLGLAVAYSIIKDHGGTILVESKINHGSCFKIYLPIQEIILEQEVVEEQHIKELSPSKGESVLVVDDESQLREIVQEMLSGDGYHVTEAVNGKEALEIYEKMMQNGERFDLVILDLSMPVMDGKTCAKHLLELDPDVRILITTGHAGDPESLIANAHGILQKPFNLTALLQEVKRILVKEKELIQSPQECMLQ